MSSTRPPSRSLPATVHETRRRTDRLYAPPLDADRGRTGGERR